MSPTDPDATWAIDVAYRPGVTDNEGESIRVGAAHAGLHGLDAVRTLRRVYLRGALPYEVVEELAYGLLANDLVEGTLISLPDDTSASAAFYSKLIRASGAPDAAHRCCRAARCRRRGADAHQPGRACWPSTWPRCRRCGPTTARPDASPPTASSRPSRRPGPSTARTRPSRRWCAIRQTHSPATTSRAIPATIDGILRTLLMEPTRAINPPWLSRRLSTTPASWPSATTRSRSRSRRTTILRRSSRSAARTPASAASCAMCWASRRQPIANTDVLCFGPPDLSAPTQLPGGVLHPRRIAAGVVAGVRDYGNKLGIPTVNGAVLYDPGYTAQPAGVLRHGRALRRAASTRPGASPAMRWWCSAGAPAATASTARPSRRPS